MERTVTLMDGAAGTALWALADKRSIPRTPVWQYNLTHPALVRALARRYIAAGSRLILTNTFCANRPMVEKYAGFRPEEVVRAGVRLAREAVGERDVRVALSVGPLAKAPADAAERRAAAAVYDEQIGAGADAGADCVLLETFGDTALLTLAAERAAACRLPLLCAMTFGENGRTYTGCTPAELAAAMGPLHPEAVGVNCSCGPAGSLTALAELRRCTDLPLLFKPNAPSGHTATDFLRAVAPALSYVRYIGGCCGTTPADIACLRGYLDA